MNAVKTAQLDRTFYLESQQKFVDLAKTYSDVLAVYSAGTIKHPGISDLDFVVCLKDKLTTPFDIEEHLPADVASLVTTGSILKVNESLMGDVNIIDQFPLTHLTGKRYDFNKYDDLTFNICRVLDWLPERFFVLNHFRWTNEEDILHGLRILKSFTVSLYFLKRITGDDQHDQFVRSLGVLRDNWLAEPNPTTFANLFSEARHIAAVALNDLDKWLVDNEFVVIQPPAAKVTFSVPNGPSFAFGKISMVSDDKVTVPWTVAAFLTAQSMVGRGFIARNIGQCFNYPLATSSFKINEELRKTISKRLDYVESLAEFFRDNGLTKGLLKYGWFLNE